MAVDAGVLTGGGVVVEPALLEAGGVTGVVDCEPLLDVAELGALDELPPPPPPLQAVMSNEVKSAAMILYGVVIGGDRLSALLKYC